jgi:RNA polymerase sigma-70 factor, ECF subfamily
LALLAALAQSVTGVGRIREPNDMTLDRAEPAATSSSMTDDFALMDAIALERDPDALRAFYDRHASVVYAVCLRVLRDRHEAEDLLVEIFQELWDKSDRYDALRASPRTYLMTLTRSRAIDRKRRLSGASATVTTVAESGELDEPAASTTSSNLSPVEATILTERRAIVIDALHQLEPAQRQAIECAYYDGLSHSEIAEKLNKPLGTVKTYIRQGLIRLRQALQRESLAGGTVGAT